MHLPSISVLPTIIRENLLRETFPREPERDLVMEDAEIIDDYLKAGQDGAGLVAAHILAAGFATQAIQGCKRVIDLGCGPATQLTQIAKLNPEISFVGVDLSDEMLDRARQTVAAAGVTNVELVKGDATRLTQFADHSFDGAISAFALHHLPTKEHLKQCFLETRRVLTPGGAVSFMDCGRLKSLKSVLFFAYRDTGRLPYLFMLDTERSLRAAFSLDEFKHLTQECLVDDAQVFSTFSVPLLVVIRTKKRASLSDAQRAELWRMRQALKPKYRRDLDDMRLFFSLGGMRDDPFKS